MGRAFEVRKSSMEKTSVEKSKIYSRFGREIYQAAKNGSTEIKSNPQLKSLIEKAKKLWIVAGKDPMGIAAAALYLACISTGEVKSQKDISIASGVTEVTIRNRCAGLRKMMSTE